MVRSLTAGRADSAALGATGHSKRLLDSAAGLCGRRKNASRARQHFARLCVLQLSPSALPWQQALPHTNILGWRYVIVCLCQYRSRRGAEEHRAASEERTQESSLHARILGFII